MSKFNPHLTLPVLHHPPCIDGSQHHIYALDAMNEGVCRRCQDHQSFGRGFGELTTSERRFGESVIVGRGSRGMTVHE